MTTSTSLTLRALLKSAANRSGMDLPGGVVAGLTPSAKALMVAAAASAQGASALVYVVPSDAEVEEAVSDLRFFFSAMEGLAEPAVASVVLPFPSQEVDPYRGLAPHFSVASARARALHALASGACRVVVASAAALLPRVSSPTRLLAASIVLRPGLEIAPPDLAELLVDAGFRREDPVDEHGEFTVRGGIVDVYPPDEAQPVRVEFFGDTVESLRRYDPATQRSVASVDQLGLVPLREVFPGVAGALESRAFEPHVLSPEAQVQDPDRSGAFFDYVSHQANARLIVSEGDEVETHAMKLVEQLQRGYDDARARKQQAPEVRELFVGWDEIARRLDSATLLNQLFIQAPVPRRQAPVSRSESPVPSPEPPAPREIRCQPAMESRGRIADWAAEIRRLRAAGEMVLFVAATAGRAERTIELLKEYELFARPVDQVEDARYAAVLVATGRLSRGFRLPDAGLQIFSETDVFEEEHRAGERRKSASKAFLSDLRDLKVGDFVVHVDHGIGVFVGLKRIGVGTSSDGAQEFMELRYAGDDKLFVPVERLDLVQKYTGGARPPVDRLGGATWERAKTRVKKAMRDMAEELLKLYAQRKAVAGHAFSPDSHWQQEFEGAFEYELTPDQETAVADIKRDMESPTPMDRLLCGDVGYGKTEVAMRAAFKAVMDGKQAAFLAPTTVLAFQHQKTLTERFAGFPVRIDMVSRFRTKQEQKEVLADLAAGKVDVIVGTHRLLSKDVEFRDLGLLVVDEEQRFGVTHKERIKQIKRRVDVLTMTATPIPRTLNMSLVGIRDMSIIETPPKDRLSIQTNVVKFDQQVIGRAIRTEMERGGQVFFVHNRVESIFSIGNLVQRLVPEARIVIGHGQMDEDTLERAMLDFMARKFDVLLATTIVENGLDIPNANTIIINRADRYGLAQLYQLRGRVGRSDRPAYAYLLIPPEESLSAVAKKRLAAIKEFSDLGSGFRVAALDLEIRGAGNLLGGEQSGHIDAVGFEMYMKLLEEAVRELKGEAIEDRVTAAVNLGVDLRIEDTYVPDMNQRLMLYRKVAAARQQAELDRVLDEMVDRYGPLPDSVMNLGAYGSIRIMADRVGIESIDRQGSLVVLKFKPQAKVDPARLIALVRQRADLALAPPAALKLDLVGIGDLGLGIRGAAERSSNPQSPIPNPGTRGPLRQGGATPSWWTARAKAGEVRPGFSKGEILKPKAADPKALDGVFTKVGTLLRELSELIQER